VADTNYPLTQRRLQAGVQIMKMTDDVGFDAYSVVWLYDRSDATWRLVMSTPMLNAKGSLWVYKRLLRVFRNCPLPEGVTPLDIVVIDLQLEFELYGDGYPGDVLDLLSPEQAEQTMTISRRMRIGQFDIDNGEAFFLRRLDPRKRKRRRRSEDLFDRQVSMLKAA